MLSSGAGGAWRLFLAVRKRNIKSVFCTLCINTQLLLVQSCLVVRRIYFYSNFAKYLSIADFCNNSDCYLHFTWGLLEQNQPYGFSLICCVMHQFKATVSCYHYVLGYCRWQCAHGTWAPYCKFHKPRGS